MANKKICFVGLDSYPVLNPKMGNHYFGGESVQQTLLAKAFVEKGYEVTLVSLDYGQPDNQVVSGVKVLKTYKEGSGLPVLRFFYPKIYTVWKALKEADADIYFQSCAGALTGIVAYFCKKYNKKFIFRLAHDSDCIPGEHIIPNKRDVLIYEYGLKNTDLISAQGIKQVELLKKNYSLKSTPVNMTVEIPSEVEIEKELDVLWVNNFRQFKRPELMLEIAKKLPDINFYMIGGPVPGNEDLFESVKSAADDVKNLNVMGSIPYDKVNDYFSQTKLFVNTSDWEGFPNSFLQAWARGVPVIAFFDPDDLIVNKSIGASPSNIDEMVGSISEILNSDNYDEMSQRARVFAIENYSPNSIADVYEELLE